MSNEKMREEFEAWYATRGKSTYYAKEISWMAWQASRSALCVEFPMEYKDQFNELSYSAPAVIKAILDAGVRYK